MFEPGKEGCKDWQDRFERKNGLFLNQEKKGFKDWQDHVERKKAAVSEPGKKRI
ncbi:hypothetical protein [Sphingobacterium hotanense]|uniref:hypothetical protein n=1 Tax=Sphingobacterium hotanense TaxID=649196 RepID=UPI00257843C4|nr:hypothetical protein [Sphingobacterium hotanense]